MGYETLLLEREGAVLSLILNRPEKLNAISPRLLEEMAQALDEISRMENLRLLVIRGAGRAFSSGTDLKALAGQGLERVPTAFRYHLARMQEVFNRVSSLEKPVLAVIHGYALGAAMELALACDFRICTLEARFALPEVQYCLVPDLGGCQRLVRILGVARAKEFVMLGRAVDGAKAQELGLVNKAVSSDRLDQELNAWKEELLALPPLSIGLAKRVVDLSPDTGLQAALEYTSQVQASLITSRDFQEAIRAKLEKRQPQFQGV
jgi:enoyl-CoA hydratase/carnithine racemase